MPLSYGSPQSKHAAVSHDRLYKACSLGPENRFVKICQSCPTSFQSSLASLETAKMLMWAGEASFCISTTGRLQGPMFEQKTKPEL